MIKDKIKKLLSPRTVSKAMGIVMRNYGTPSAFQPRKQLQGITFKAIDFTSEAVSKYKPLAMRANGKPYESHPIYNIDKKPNSNQLSNDYKQLWAMIYEIYGETFTYLAKGENSNRVKEIIQLNPEQVQLHHDSSTGELDGYILHKSNGTQVPLLVDEIIHDKKPNPFNPSRGLSILEKASTYIDIEINTADFTLNYIKNSASPSGVMSLPDMGKETFKLFAQQWRENYEGPQNAGKTAIIRGGEAKFQAVGSTLKDIDQEITRKMAKEDVLIMFGVPKGLLGASGEKGLGRSDIEPLEYIFSKYKVEPLMLRLDSIYERIGESFGREGVVDITHASPIPADKKHNLERQVKGTNVWLTINEARAIDGLDPIADGDTIKEKAPVTPTAQKKIKVVAKKQPSNADTAKRLSNEQEDFRSNLVSTNEIYEKKIKREISKFARSQYNLVVSKIDATNKGFEEWLFNVKTESEILTGLIEPVMIELMMAQGDETANFITGEAFELTPQIKRTVNTRIKKIAGVYNAETIKKLESTLSSGVDAGESLVKLKKRVQGVYEGAEGYRAERIARTESLRSSNQSAELVYKQNGFSKVEWFINPGACEFCRTFSGRTKEIGGKYNNIGDVITGDEGGEMSIHYDDVEYPPLHPNCTCSLIPVE